MFNKYDETGKVICQECGRAFDIISPTHLSKSHKMNLVEYKRRHEGFPVASQSFGAKQKFGEAELLDTKATNQEEIKIEDLNDFDLDKIPDVSKDITKSVTSFIDEIKVFAKNEPQEKKTFNNVSNIHKNKIKILNFLVTYFPDLQNSFFIEKKDLSGSLLYRLVTDICSPSNRIDFEFPNTFWHNSDIPKYNRDLKLTEVGCTILNFPGPNPTTAQIKEVLIKNNLI